MRSPKRYTDLTFKKRVDHESESGVESRSKAPPSICTSCGLIFLNGRWMQEENPGELLKHKHFKPPRFTICPTCRKEKEELPCGVVHLSGGFLLEHRKEIDRLIQNEEKRAQERNPLHRIIGKQGGDSDVLLQTSTEQLAVRLGKRIKRAFAGELDLDFSHENKLVRVYWSRD